VAAAALEYAIHIASDLGVGGIREGSTALSAISSLTGSGRSSVLEPARAADQVRIASTREAVAVAPYEVVVAIAWLAEIRDPRLASAATTKPLSTIARCPEQLVAYRTHQR
jgi:hypothetical protein